MATTEAAGSAPLSPAVFHILLALAGGERHGYAMMKEVTPESGGVRMGPGTLYRLVKQLQSDGWIAEVASPEDEDERRRVYRLTPRGRRIAEAEARRLEQLLHVARARKLLAAPART